MRIRRKKESAIKNFEDFLKGCNCTYDIEKEDNATIIRFEFQAGHFVASFRPQDDCVEVTYPCIASAPLSLLDLVRSKCNDRNNSNILFKFSYSIDHEQNEVNVHISFFNNIVNPDEMKDELSAVFRFQRDWIKDGCAGTVQAGKDFCWSNDKCICLWENYTNDWDTCPDGKPHEFEYDSSNKKYTCKRCYHSYYKSPGSTGLFRPSAEHKII